MTVNIIDPHLHLFNRSRGDYHWLKTQNPPFWSDKSIIQQDFSIDDINHSLLVNNNIKLSGFIHIEAGFDNTKPWRELEFIESLACQKNRTIASIDLLTTPEHFQATLKRLQQCHSFIGARHILDEQAYAILASQHSQQNFASLNEVTDFIFELQLPLADESAINVMQLLRQIISNNSQLRFIINHAGFPPKVTSKDINCDAWFLWQQHITELAKYPNVFIKCSGWEMQDRQYKMSWFSKVTSFCIKAFSVERVMLASNFPLCLLGRKVGIKPDSKLSNERENKVGSKDNKNFENKLSNKDYESYWLDILRSDVIQQCNENEKNALLYHNALHIYQLSNAER